LELLKVTVIVEELELPGETVTFVTGQRERAG
jgi:hypothetical protein